MIVYGLTMQAKTEEVPVELAAWLLERNTRYLNTIEFKVDVYEVPVVDAAQYQPVAEKYSQLFARRNSTSGISDVSFLFKTQTWTVRIIGGSNADGTLADRNEQTTLPLSAAQRAEIAGLDTNAEQVNELVFGILRKSAEPLKERPTEMMALPADGRWTSEVSMSGAELKGLMGDPNIRDLAAQAIWQKDWDTIKRLKEERS